MTVKVLFFAGLREALGTGSEALALPAGIATVGALRDIVVAMGLDSPWRIAPMDIYQRTSSAEARAFDKVYPFLEPGELLGDPLSTAYARPWRQASADTFSKQA